MIEESCKNCEHLRTCSFYDRKHSKDFYGFSCNLFDNRFEMSFMIALLDEINSKCECYKQAVNCLHCEHYDNGKRQYCKRNIKRDLSVRECPGFKFTDRHVKEFQETKTGRGDFNGQAD